MSNNLLTGFVKQSIADISTEWAVYGSPTVPLTSVWGTENVRIQGNNECIAHAITADAEYFDGFRFVLEADSVSFCVVCYFVEGTIMHGRMDIDSSRRIRFVDGGGTVRWTGATILSLNTPYYLRPHVKIDNSVGKYECYINSAASPDATVFTGDTRNGGTSGVIDTIAFGYYPGQVSNGSQGNATHFRITDLYCNSATGADATSNVSWPEMRVFGKLAQADGNDTSMTPDTGSDLYSRINEATTDGDTSYIHSAAGGRALFPMATDGLGVTVNDILGMCARPMARKADATSLSLGLALRVGSADHDLATTVALGTSYAQIPFLMGRINPTTGVNYTQAELETPTTGLEIGPKVS